MMPIFHLLAKSCLVIYAEDTLVLSHILSLIANCLVLFTSLRLVLLMCTFLPAVGVDQVFFFGTKTKSYGSSVQQRSRYFTQEIFTQDHLMLPIFITFPVLCCFSESGIFNQTPNLGTRKTINNDIRTFY